MVVLGSHLGCQSTITPTPETDQTSPSPAAVKPLSAPFERNESSRKEILKRTYLEVKVADSSPHTCAVRKSGILDCWGEDGEVKNAYSLDENGKVSLSRLNEFMVTSFDITIEDAHLRNKDDFYVG